MPSRGRASALAAGLAALGFLIAVPLVATAASDQPVGLRYDDWNRLFTIPLLALAVAVAGYRLQRPGRAADLALAAAAAMVLGNAIEFWAAVGQDDAVSAIARDRPGEGEWAGSSVGSPLFAVGVLALIGASVTHAVRAARERRIAAAEAVAEIAVPCLLLACLVAWRSSPAAAAVPAALLAGALAVVGRSLARVD